MKNFMESIGFISIEVEHLQINARLIVKTTRYITTEELMKLSKMFIRKEDLIYNIIPNREGIPAGLSTTYVSQVDFVYD